MDSPEHLFCQTQSPSRVVDDLHGLDPRELVEEPAATGVHQHGVTLHLEKLQDVTCSSVLERTNGVIGEKCCAIFFGAVQDDLNVIVARRPWILEIGF